MKHIKLFESFSGTQNISEGVEIQGNGKKFFYNELLKFQKDFFKDAPESVMKRVSKIGDHFAEMDKSQRNEFFSKVGRYKNLMQLLKGADGFLVTIRSRQRNYGNISEMYYGGKYDIIGEYNNDEFDEFVDAVESWEERTGSHCPWTLYPGHQHVNQVNYMTTVRKNKEEAKKLAKQYWDMYVKPGKRMVLVEGDVFLFSAVVGTDGEVELCVDSDDRTVDKMVLKRIEDTIQGNM